MTTEACIEDCPIQNYPNYPYGPGAESLFSKVVSSSVGVALLFFRLLFLSLLSRSR